MELTLTSFMALVRETLTDPKAGARRIMTVDMPATARWQALLLVVVLSVLFGQISLRLMVGDVEAAGMAGSPFLSGLAQGGLLLLMVYAVHHVGRAMGGTGSFGHALSLVTWLQAIMVVIQAVQILLLVVLPPFAGILGVAGMVVFMWLLTNFVAVLHGFESLGRVFVAIIVTGFGLAFLAAMVMTILGIQPTGMM